MPVFVFTDAQFFHRVTKFVHYYHCIIIIIIIQKGMGMHFQKKMRTHTPGSVWRDFSPRGREAEPGAGERLETHARTVCVWKNK